MNLEYTFLFSRFFVAQAICVDRLSSTKRFVGCCVYLFFQLSVLNRIFLVDYYRTVQKKKKNSLLRTSKFCRKICFVIVYFKVLILIQKFERKHNRTEFQSDRTFCLSFLNMKTRLEKLSLVGFILLGIIPTLLEVTYKNPLTTNKEYRETEHYRKMLILGLI